MQSHIRARGSEGAHGVRECNTAALKKEYGGRERAQNLGEPEEGDDCLELESSMAERRLRAPDPGAQLGVSSCLGKCWKSSPDAGRRHPFSGKSFYLDLPAGRNLQFLTGAIQHLGGVIEGFLSKDVSYIISSRREAKTESNGTSHRGCSSPSDLRVEILTVTDPKGSHARPPQKPIDSVLLSRGKKLLQKAIGNQGSSSGGSGSSSSSLFTNARSWGVRILHVDEMMIHVQQLSLDALCVKKQGPKKPEGTCPAESRTQKVARLKAPFLKIEDESRNFRPFHHQFKSFPEIYFLGPKDASPFETPTTPGSSHHTRSNECGLEYEHRTGIVFQTILATTPHAHLEPKDRESAAGMVPRRKKGYCECCQEAFAELRGHLQSAQHQGFALEAHPYAKVDQIIAQLSHSFAEVPLQASQPRQPGSPALDRDPLCPEPLPPRKPLHAGAASPRVQKEDDLQPLDIPEQDGVRGGRKAPAEPVDEMPRPVASCQDLGGSGDFIVDPPGTPVSRTPASPGLLTSSGFVDLSSGPALALVGHKRKVQFPSSNAEKRPQAAFFVPRAPRPCDTSQTNSKHFPLPGHKPRPLASLLPLCHPQTSLSLPDPTPSQPTDRPSELWATQPPWPGGGCSPGLENSECAAPGPASQQAAQLPSGPAGPGQLSAHLHSAAGTQPPGGPVESQAASLPCPLPASRGASCSQWLWGPQPLPVPCLPVSQPQPSAELTENTSAECCTPSQGNDPGPPQQSGGAQGLACDAQANSVHGQVLPPPSLQVGPRV